MCEYLECSEHREIEVVLVFLVQVVVDELSAEKSRNEINIH